MFEDGIRRRLAAVRRTLANVGWREEAAAGDAAGGTGGGAAGQARAARGLPDPDAWLATLDALTEFARSLAETTERLRERAGAARVLVERIAAASARGAPARHLADDLAAVALQASLAAIGAGGAGRAVHTAAIARDPALEAVLRARWEGLVNPGLVALEAAADDARHRAARLRGSLGEPSAADALHLAAAVAGIARAAGPLARLLGGFGLAGRAPTLDVATAAAAGADVGDHRDASARAAPRPAA